MLLTKYIVLVIVLFTIVQGQFAVGKIFDQPGCQKDSQVAWAAVEANRCYAESSGIYFKVTCESGSAKGHMCFDAGCEYCQVQERRFGCSSEFGINYELSCGEKPTQRPRDIYSTVYQSSNCQGEPRAHVGVLSHCLSGPGVSARFQCNEREGRYMGEQFDNMDCTPPAARIQYVNSGCNNILGFSYKLAPCGKNNTTGYISK